MTGFQPLIQEIRDFLRYKKAQGVCREIQADKAVHWPPAGARDIVLLPDLALELGHPQEASLCFLMWTSERKLVNDNAISLIGPDIPEAASGCLPFGKIVLVATDPSDEGTTYERYRSMDLARFSLSLKGFMLRATSQYMREWSRISREAVNKGFSFHILGTALIREIKAIEGVTAVEVVFITQSRETVNALKEAGIRVNRMIQAMHKMMNEMEPDCKTCEYQDVCGSAAEMQALRKTLAKRTAEG